MIALTLYDSDSRSEFASYMVCVLTFDAESSGQAKMLIESLQRLCFPLVSIGKQHMARKATMIREPDAKTGAFGLAPPA